MIKVLKFGGSSLEQASNIKRAISITKERTNSDRPIVVVSALGGVTNQLITITQVAESNPEVARDIKNQLLEQHLRVIRDLGIMTAKIEDFINDRFDALSNLINHPEPFKPGVWKDRILAIGEQLSAYIFADALSKYWRKAKPYEAQHFIRTDDTHGQAEVDTETTKELIQTSFGESNGVIPVITGFIGGTKKKQITTLGRSGSDYTAGLIAEALQAERLEIWTDVDGVMSADPSLVASAETIKQLGYDEIAELSRHGANVVHPKTVNPLKNLDIPLFVKNSYNPTHPGTEISSNHQQNGTFRSLTLNGPFTFLILRSDDDKQFNDAISYILDEFSKRNIEFRSRLIQYEDRHAVLIFETDHIADAQKIVEELEIDRKHDTEVILKKRISQIKLFNNSTLDDEHLSNRILKLLARKKINPVDFIIPDNQRYVSIFLDNSDLKTAARLINDHFCIDDNPVHLFVAGIGTVGGTLLQQIEELSHPVYNLKVIGVCNRTNSIWKQSGIDVSSLTNELKHGEPTNWDRIIDQLTEPHRHQLIFVDCTGDEGVARRYADLFRHGVHVVTPSKQAHTREQSYYKELIENAKANQAHFLYETTAGAGLPVISTIKDLNETGDQINEISGVLSGTLNFLFDNLEQGKSFSEIIKTAKEEGYSEPDPRDDLSGEDVARKFMILARTSGLTIERDELKVESLSPEDLQDVPLEEFMDGISNYDEFWKDRINKAVENGNTLRYIGSLKDGMVTIGVQEVSKDSPLGQLSGTDNMVQIKSERYSVSPITIQGPGAGKEVTAAGILADILKISSIIVD